MSDYTELKRLADGAVSSGDHWGRRDSFERRLAKLVGPETVLALIAENERLHAMTGTTMGVGSGEGSLFVHGDYDSIKAAQAIVIERDQLRAEVAGLRTGYEAYERVNAELKQKVANFEVCQTASLGMSGIIKCVAGELGFDAAGEDSAQDYLIGLARRASELKAENEALRATSSLVVLIPELDSALEDLEIHGQHSDQGYRKLKDWYRKVDLACKAIDAAMGKGEQS